MYSTCLFCNASLGANESLRHFPVGRRLAYDSATARLWVVCKNCARWNLSPLDARLEAIEEAERLFRATKTRVATDNIGLAKLDDGTELIRIGKPPEIELAVWRYGDQFTARYRKVLINSSLLAGAFAIPTAAISQLGFSSAQAPFYIGAGVMATGEFVHGFVTRHYDQWRHRVMPIVSVRDNENNLLRLTQDNVNAATLAAERDGEWVVALPHVTVKSAGKRAQLIGARYETDTVQAPEMLRGDPAMQALATLLPSVNRMGTNSSGVKAAARVIQASKNLDALLQRASEESVYQASRFAPRFRANQIAFAPPDVRLALEMSLHADAERRAMQGELAELERRWRDADVIAKISDEMFLPEAVDAQLREYQRDERGPESRPRGKQRTAPGSRERNDDATTRTGTS